MSDDAGVVATIRNHVDEHRDGMVVDLVFALTWVTVVSLLFELVQGPSWAYQLCLAAGVVAYFGFFTSLSMAKEQTSSTQ
ncbi:hypothetical protein SAMN04487950_0579 [Halogranum rubrum]|uniref:DUF8119 domain-containing protein n=2 Tax=Halogranum rubrum TaxID=553466 RepID=A0A1I4BJT0_9EURY|nr:MULTISPECIES: hypothetical protein [Halogranum]EJN57965.1 hypothetical protein HSB1_33820 [Halogranum salarium B-1]SFK68630.1 hypothetical protein SAMN04487950_0579 [Halogranum rubrum]